MRHLPALALLMLISGTTPADQKPVAPLGPGDHFRAIESGGQKRYFHVHIPKSYDPNRPLPVVLALHGAAMTGGMMVGFSGLNETSEKEGFIVVYPSGTGRGPFLTWNAGGFVGRMAENRPDDVAFIASLLDDLARLVTYDKSRVYACGMSNGAMMCYRLAAELSDRIAAIAPVAGTIAVAESRPSRPVPVVHFHGLKDNIVPYGTERARTPSFMKFKGVEESIATWVELNGCDKEPIVDVVSKPGDAMKVTRKIYAGGKGASEVVLIVVENGGHTWPGQPAPIGFVGKSAENISANDMMWEFFRRFKLD